MVEVSPIIVQVLNYVFKNGQHRPLILFILVLFQIQIRQNQLVCFSGIQTRIVGVKGEHADPLTTPRPMCSFYMFKHLA